MRFDMVIVLEVFDPAELRRDALKLALRRGAALRDDTFGTENKPNVKACIHYLFINVMTAPAGATIIKTSVV